MLGIEDPGIYLAYLLTILCALLCVWYGIKNWNKGAEDEAQQLKEEAEWSKKEKKVKDTL